MRVALHRHDLTQEDIAGVVGMQRINLRMLRSRQVINVVALNGLVEKRDAQEERNRDDEE